ncbi:PREDICTED: glutaredoxin domain-containing cysteine-rich protein CG31559-like [Amphimedon queenslandica]|uniref:Glutaredoxin domain-containing protein n=1 Tax=Amphimedon queenslandica TaxID=400682 RepID=A0A1X7TNJ5_AMPQE|nr:PREDICTED: glutaredoxin domain-containing cysteine-rich protein CG31559-like [Amphimedon queenslandica]|eukprot:XP_003390163.1 PREDICTED: glutaredoxin domain-containing cysteine-rich protein CG31559-like [Amphimedon queenslandica]
MSSDAGKQEKGNIITSEGAVIGVKNKVRDGLAAFEGKEATQWMQMEESKIIVYTTSFSGVRRAHEDCKYILGIFHNHRVKVEERDVYASESYHRELEERLKGADFTLPQVFINGQHIGDKEMVDELNEIGELKKMLQEFPKINTSITCQMCGGYDFIPCIKCGGSKNSVFNNFTSEFRALKCTACDENGLQPCPHCKS